MKIMAPTNTQTSKKLRQMILLILLMEPIELLPFQLELELEKDTLTSNLPFHIGSKIFIIMILSDLT